MNNRFSISLSVLIGFFALNYSMGQELSKLRSAAVKADLIPVLVDSALLYSTAQPDKAFDYIEKALTYSIEERDKEGNESD